MYKKIAIIGIGSLGGYVVNSISNIEKIKELILIDHDIVESKNLTNTIYRKKDVGKLKVDALEDIIKNKNDNIKIIKKYQKFIESKTENETIIPKCDLIIDCRDYTYSRSNEIDIRPFISSRYLIIDCRKNVLYKNQHKGKYITKLTKNDLRNASVVLSTLIDNGQIQDCIKNHQVNKFDLDYLKKFVKINKDIIYDSVPGEDRFINLVNNILPIIEASKKNDIKISVGPKNTPMYEKLIPKKSLTNSNDVILNLASMLNFPCVFNNYVVSLSQSNKQYFIELIPETGAA